MEKLWLSSYSYFYSSGGYFPAMKSAEKKGAGYLNHH
jgi:hypothetical protein